MCDPLQDARGDQCDNCTRTFASPIELLKPRCKRSVQHELVVRPSSHMYMRLDEIQPKLEQWMEGARVKGEWDANVVINAKGEIVEPRMKGGLRPSPITRDLSWGVAVPETGDAQEDAAMKGKVMCESRPPAGLASLSGHKFADLARVSPAPRPHSNSQTSGSTRR